MEEFLLEYLNNCVLSEKSGNIGWFYSKSHVRDNKINLILDLEIFKSTDIKDMDMVFYQDSKNHYFKVRYDIIWQVFESKYNMNYQQIQEFIRGILERDFKLGGYTAKAMNKPVVLLLERDFKLGGYTACKCREFQIRWLYYQDLIEASLHPTGKRFQIRWLYYTPFSYI